MAEKANITRRAALIGAVTSAAALAVPVVPTIAANLRPEGILDGLIARHNAAYLHLDACVAREFKIDDRLPSLRLAYAWVLDEQTQAHSRPLFIRDRAELRTLVRQQPRYQYLVPRWEALEQQYHELRRSSGLLDAIKVREAAERSEEAARLALAVYRPVDTAEAQGKIEYMTASAPFRENWCHDEPQLIDALLMALCQPTNIA